MKIPSTGRIETFSDGVMAIIITILVLELRLPELPDEFSLYTFYHALFDIAPKLLAYLFSFLVIAIFWINHHNLLHHLSHTNAGLLWHNNHLLLWLSLIPIPTGFIGEHPTHKYAIALYAFIMFMAALSFTLMSKYAMFKGALMTGTVTADRRKALLRRSWFGPSIYGLSIIAAFIHPYIAWVLFVCVPVYFFWPKSIQQENSYTSNKEINT
ncbi:MAG: DUF1211 domain-containing protein [Cytophagia bacterium]|nr:DUF1211 domain-containing protein [Cytophagia bacterium]